MGLINELEPATGMFSQGFSKFVQFRWILIGIFIVLAIGSIIYFINLNKKKKSQWTHKLQIRRILNNGSLTNPETIRMKRFVAKGAKDLFELEKPFLGSWLVPKMGDYVDNNTFSIILDKDNRIWFDMGTTYNKKQECSEISISHGGVDVTMNNIHNNWHAIHKQNKKITTAELIKAGIMVLAIVAITIISIVAISKWGESQEHVAEKAKQEAVAMENLAQALESMEGIVQTQQGQIIPMLKALYGTENVAYEINKYKEEK